VPKFRRRGHAAHRNFSSSRLCGVGVRGDRRRTRTLVPESGAPSQAHGAEFNADRSGDRSCAAIRAVRRGVSNVPTPPQTPPPIASRDVRRARCPTRPRCSSPPRSWRLWRDGAAALREIVFAGGKRNLLGKSERHPGRGRRTSSGCAARLPFRSEARAEVTPPVR